MRILWALTLAGLLCMVSPAALAADIDLKKETGHSEAEVEEAIRDGRLKADDLIKAGENIGYFTKLRMYLYSLELGEYFDGVEDSFRNLARANPDDPELLKDLGMKMGQALAKSRAKLMASDREQKEKDWRRGLVGLIFLDQDWRRRVAEDDPGEITNPYDFVAMMDCVDAIIRGLSPESFASCPVGPKPDQAEKDQ